MKVLLYDKFCSDFNTECFCWFAINSRRDGRKHALLAGHENFKYIWKVLKCTEMLNGAALHIDGPNKQHNSLVKGGQLGDIYRVFRLQTKKEGSY